MSNNISSPCSVLTNNLRRQIDKTLRPFKCSEDNCNIRPFGDQAGLIRHRREVHQLDSNGKPVYKFTCPETGCPRHKRGFGRQWNMVQHFRRRHATKDLDGSAPRLPPTLMEISGDSEDEQEVASNARIAGGFPVIVCEELRVKFGRLEQEKKRISLEMEAVQKVIEVFERKGSLVGSV